MKSMAGQQSPSLSSTESPLGAGTRALRRLTVVTLALLAVQYLFGMTVNLFVTIPASHPGSNADNYFSGVAQGVAWAIAHGAGFLQLHATFGLLLVAAAIALLVLAIRSRRRAWIVATSIALLTILGAGFNGASFLNYNHDFSSMIMASLFLIAVCAYAIALYVTR
jgi:hypothetical protein